VKDKTLFKKWWFWVAIVLVLGGIGSLGQSSEDNKTDSTNSQSTTTNTTSTATLPKLNTADYKGKEGLLVYKELKSKGYKVDAAFENQALTDINGKASDLFEPLDPSKPSDKQSVDAFVVGELVQDGDSITLKIAKSSN
jgi:hypothetical protein